MPSAPSPAITTAGAGVRLYLVAYFAPESPASRILPRQKRRSPLGPYPAMPRKRYPAELPIGCAPGGPAPQISDRPPAGSMDPVRAKRRAGEPTFAVPAAAVGALGGGHAEGPMRYHAPHSLNETRRYSPPRTRAVALFALWLGDHFFHGGNAVVDSGAPLFLFQLKLGQNFLQYGPDALGNRRNIFSGQWHISPLIVDSHGNRAA